MQRSTTTRNGCSDSFEAPSRSPRPRPGSFPSFYQPAASRASLETPHLIHNRFMSARVHLSLCQVLERCRFVGVHDDSCGNYRPMSPHKTRQREQAWSVPSSRVSPTLRMLPKQRRFISQGAWPVLTSAYVSCEALAQCLTPSREMRV